MYLTMLQPWNTSFFQSHRCSCGEMFHIHGRKSRYFKHVEKSDCVESGQANKLYPGKESWYMEWPHVPAVWETQEQPGFCHHLGDGSGEWQQAWLLCSMTLPLREGPLDWDLSHLDEEIYTQLLTTKVPWSNRGKIEHLGFELPDLF